MLLITLRILFALICAGAFLTFVDSDDPSIVPVVIQDNRFSTFLMLMFITQSVTFADILIKRKRLEYISAVYFGLLIGIFLSFLLNQALATWVAGTQWQFVTYLSTTLVLPYICISLLLQTKDDFRFIIPYIEFARDVKGGRPYLLDTSSIIDGRIADVIETKILDSELIVPNFILEELQDIADSSDKLRRNRGRRGLDVLGKLQSNPKIDVRLHESDMSQLVGMTVDQKLVSVAKKLGGRVVTNDFNLNKVASVQGVDVINLNDVANSLKPRYLPGEQLQIKVIKPGEGAGQGVGYLDDGTMVVCEQGNGLIGKEIQVVVTSVLQNSAGRMIFGRLPTHSDRH